MIEALDAQILTRRPKRTQMELQLPFATHGAAQELLNKGNVRKHALGLMSVDPPPTFHQESNKGAYIENN